MDLSTILMQKKKKLISAVAKTYNNKFLQQHSAILDEYFLESFYSSLAGSAMGLDKNPYAIIALGGYGRQEQCIHSDIDLLFLFKKNIPEKAEELIQEIVYPLWDIKLDVGHATRTLKECISLAGEEYEVLTSLMDARFLCGISQLYLELRDQLRKKVIFRQSKKIINWLVETSLERHHRFGDSTYLLQPNLKEGQGGLRDYHAMCWIAKAKFNLIEDKDFECYGYLSHSEYEGIRNALSFIWHIRNSLHFLSDRKCDQLYFEYQIQLADNLNYKGKNGQQPVERFLGELHCHMELLKQHYLMFIYEHGKTIKKKRCFKNGHNTKANNIKIVGGRLDFLSSNHIVNSPDLLMTIFEQSARLKLPLSSEANRVVREFLYLFTDDYANWSPVVRSFERILVAPASIFNVLNEMLRTGFLVCFIPEIHRIVNRIQYNQYHIFPVDKHSLRTVQTIKKFIESEIETQADNLCVMLYKDIKRKPLLLWAALLHDIGKGEQGEDHALKGAKIVKNILKRKGYGSKDIEIVSFLVKEHLFLIKIATRRDINDEETAIFCAKRIRDVELLKMLYLLTVGDSISTGPKAWNDWMSYLLRDLFFKILSILEKGELASVEALHIVNKKKDQLIGSIEMFQEKIDIEALFSIMSPRYRLYMPAEEILEHIRLYKKLDFHEVVWEIAKTDNRNTRTVTICAKDSPGLFSNIAGVLTINGIDVFDARIYTWRNNIAFDIFEVRAPFDQIYENQKWDKALECLRSVIKGDLDLAAMLKERISVYQKKPQNMDDDCLYRPNKVVFDNETSSFFTIIEVFTCDFLGVLYSVTDILFRCGLDIWVAKIATKVDQVVDVFYVRDFDGQKVDQSEEVDVIKNAIYNVLLKIN